MHAISPPQVRGLRSLQVRAVDRIKRSALQKLHRSRRGERLLLRMYLAGEDATERTLLEDLLPQSPAWLERQVERHLADERRHVALFAQALYALGDKEAPRLEPDWLSKRKIMRWQRLAHKYAPRFEHGLLVPAYATGLCAEQMAERVLRRHCSVIGAQHTMYPLLSQVLGDEKAHIRLCENTLQRIVAPHEAPQLALLLKDIRAIDASFGVTGALAMYVAGLMLGSLGSAAR
ncbi:hypothetical protein [Pseudomonas californiensis]|uniref:hypothetical protein n=1 Tax=Pseudomonas californiensis TaxID=2829823 RepID=UPI001E3AF92A|nr:hypothetical protein [Pseudomonas californiensis]